MKSFQATVILLAALATTSLARQAKQACVQLPIEIDSVSTSPRGRGTSSQTCEFNRTALTYMCKISSRTAAGPEVGQVTLTTYSSIDDLVDQTRVTPPLFKAARMEMAGPKESMATSYEYDAQRRLKGEVIETPAGTTRVDYTAWDAAGRPTQSRWLTAATAPITTQVLTYDEAARIRTVVTTSRGAVSSTVQTEFDANGHQVQTRTTNASGTTTVTMTVAKSEKVCR